MEYIIYNITRYCFHITSYCLGAFDAWAPESFNFKAEPNPLVWFLNSSKANRI